MTKKKKNINNNVQIERTIVQTHSFVPTDEWIRLNNENNSLKEKLLIMEGNVRQFQEDIRYHIQTIDELRKENEMLKEKLFNFEKSIKELKKDNKNLNIENNLLKSKIDNLELYELKRNAVFMLHEFDSISNKKLQSEYRKYFNLSNKNKNIPTLRDFVLKTEMIDENDEKFWNEFIKKYPNSDNKEFRNVYVKMNKFRMKYDAHPDVTDFTKDDFDKSFYLIFPEIYTNKELFNSYKNWICQFVD